MKTAEKISERLKFKDDFDKIDFITDTIQLDLLHKLVDNTNLKKTDLAKELKVSDSFISQLFSGDKRLSLYHIASLIYHLKLDFKIELKQKPKQEYKEEAKIVKFEDYYFKDKKMYCSPEKAATKYNVQKPNEEEDPKTCCV
jgi:plasmid maintenance system antidote protein VapI